MVSIKYFVFVVYYFDDLINSPRKIYNSRFCSFLIYNLKKIYMLYFVLLFIVLYFIITGTFYLFAGLTTVGLITMFFLLPETKNKSLEEIEELFMSEKYKQSIFSSKKGSSYGTDNEAFANDDALNSNTSAFLNKMCCIKKGDNELSKSYKR
ncbi:hypothetical protein KUTeg_020757 [Tegillarca granosa]|uniref:Uncharacterized protein n=1 Tax=Tegillarca granosa TaxID=220873 RepID=A0ABQ9EEB1_TEGGR|nr:hypothetical protein KUTeg_020757 [Tegillarca granosa]